MMGMMRGARGGRDDNDDNGRQRSAVETASRDLRTTMENKAASEDDIKAKHTAFREARDKARTELATAQKELKEILMPRQEAVLVQYGMIE
jgi:Spy/CpxP family protein refolding chaperone